MLLVHAVDRPEVPPIGMPARFRTDIAYFARPAGEEGVPELGHDEYFVPQADARRWYEEGIVMLISPLDSEHQAEIEITDEQEAWLGWLIEHQVQHVRLTR